MRLLLAVGAVVMLWGAPDVVLAQSTTIAGYDAQGRLQCVRRSVIGGSNRTTTYAPYDAAGNRREVTTEAGESLCNRAGHAVVVTSDRAGINHSS